MISLPIRSEEDLMQNVRADTLKDLADQLCTSINGLYLGKLLDLQEEVKALGESGAYIANSIMCGFRDGEDQ